VRIVQVQGYYFAKPLCSAEQGLNRTPSPRERYPTAPPIAHRVPIQSGLKQPIVLIVVLEIAPCVYDTLLWSEPADTGAAFGVMGLLSPPYRTVYESRQGSQINQHRCAGETTELQMTTSHLKRNG
jgi:hypothetical protein